MAGPRRRSREVALQVLHVMDVSPELDPTAALASFFAHLATAGGVVQRDGHEPEDDDGDADDDAAAATPRLDRGLIEELVRGVTSHLAELDERLKVLSRNWRVERMAVVERNIIRIALFELTYCESVPASVAINEAVELAKRFGTSEGAAFVNGLLDRAATELPNRG
jgi:N utilization substance protein B